MRGKRVLVVDDEPSIVSAVSEALRLAGFEVATAGDGVEALQAAERSRPDALVLDVMMPRENGCRVCRTLKAQPENRAPKILLVTARRLDVESGGEATFLRYAMADGILYKPFRLSELVDRMHALLA